MNQGLKALIPQLGFCIAVVCLCIQLSQTTAPAQTLFPESPAFRPDRLLIRPKPGIASTALETFHLTQGCTVIQRFPAIGDLQIIRTSPGETILNLIAKYKSSGLVEFAEPDFIRQLNLTEPNDPKYVEGTLWGLYNYGQS